MEVFISPRVFINERRLTTNCLEKKTACGEKQNSEGLYKKNYLHRRSLFCLNLIELIKLVFLVLLALQLTKREIDSEREGRV